MKCLAVILSILAIPAAAWADDVALPTQLVLEEPAPQAEQDPEKGRMQPQEPLYVMDYIYRHSELELGAMWTDFDSDLDLEPAVGFYIRYGVGIAKGVAVTLTYRHYDFDNSDLPGPVGESVDVRGLMAGASYRLPITHEFAFVANASAGVMKWESGFHGVSDDTGAIFSAEAAATARLHEVLRLRMGLVLDFVSTDFHEDSSENMINLSWLFAIELGV